MSYINLNRFSYSSQKTKSLQKQKMQTNLKIQKTNDKVPFVKKEVQSSNKFKLKIQSLNNQNGNKNNKNKQREQTFLKIIRKDQKKPLKKLSIHYNLKDQNEQKNRKLVQRLTCYSQQSKIKKVNQFSKPKPIIHKGKKHLNLNCRFDLIQQYKKEKDKILSKDQQFQSLMCKRKTYSLSKLTKFHKQKLQPRSQLKKKTIYQDRQCLVNQKQNLEIQIHDEKRMESKELSQKKQNSIKRISKASSDLASEIIKMASIKELYLVSYELAVANLQKYFKAFQSYISFQKCFKFQNQLLTQIMNLSNNRYYYFKGIRFLLYQVFFFFQNKQIKLKFSNLLRIDNQIMIKTLKINKVLEDPLSAQEIFFKKQKDKQLKTLFSIQNLGGANYIYEYNIVFLQKLKFFRLNSREDGYAINYLSNRQNIYQISGIKRKSDSIHKIYIYLSNVSNEQLTKKFKRKIIDFVNNNFFFPLNSYGNQKFQRENIPQTLQKDIKGISNSLKSKKILVIDILNAQYSNQNKIKKCLRKKIYQSHEPNQFKDYYNFNLVQILNKNLFYNGKYQNFQIKIIAIKKQNQLQYVFLIIQPSKIQYSKCLYFSLPLKNKELFDKIDKIQKDSNLLLIKNSKTMNFQQKASQNNLFLWNLIKNCTTISSITQKIMKKKIFSKQNWSQLILNQCLLQFPYVKVVKKVIKNDSRDENRQNQFVILKIYYIKEVNFILVLVQFQAKSFFLFQQFNFLQGQKNYKCPISKIKQNQKLGSQKGIKLLKLKSNQKMTETALKQIKEIKQKAKTNMNYQKSNRFKENQQNKIKQMINFAFTYQCNIYRKYKKQNTSKTLSNQIYSQNKQKFQHSENTQIQIQINQSKFRLYQYNYCWIDYFFNCRQFCFRMKDDSLFSLKFSNKNVYMNKIQKSLIEDTIKQNQKQLFSSQKTIRQERKMRMKKSLLEKKCEEKQKYYQAFLTYRKKISNKYYYSFIYQLNILTQIDLMENQDLTYQIELLEINNQNKQKSQRSHTITEKQDQNYQQDRIQEKKVKSKQICINSSDMTIFKFKNLSIDKNLLKKTKFRKRFNKALQLKLLKQYNKICLN